MWGITFILLAVYLGAVVYQGNLVNLGPDLWTLLKGFFPFLMLILVFGFLSQKGPVESRQIFGVLSWLVVVAIIVAHGSQFLNNFKALEAKLGV